ncbi:MAG TPA: RDD family protein [Solirubrobacteraceae bacterium]|jgi:uncharacterized RDD family membrane protein YckC|nr:RDD family protein [Solirubrobacteraceae bacterium]
MSVVQPPRFAPETTHVSGRRYIAHAADGLVLLVLFLVVGVPAGIVSSGLLLAVLVVWLTVGQVAYYVLTQRQSGRTPGKRLMGIRVVDAEGRTPGTAALIRRTVPLLVEYFYVIAWLSMMTSSYRQRVGDRWADTYVIADPLPSPVRAE